MAGPNEERDPTRNRSRSEELHDAQQRQIDRASGGDPRLTGARGTVGRPYHVVIDDAADKFFDSFRTPTPEQGPQRPGEGPHGDRTGERLFRASIEGDRALAEAARQAAGEIRAHASMLGQWTADAGRFTSEWREAQEAERVRIDQVLTRIEAHYEQLARHEEDDGMGGRRRRRRGGEPPAGPSPRPGPPIPDLDNPRADGTFPPVPPPPPGGSGGGGGPAEDDGDPDRPRPTLGRPQGPARPAPHNRGYAHLGSHMQSPRTLRGSIHRATAEHLHQALGQGTLRSNTVIPVRDPSTGEISHFEERDNDGLLVRSAPVGSEEGQGMARKAMRMYTASRMAGAVAKGAGLGGVVRAGAGAAGEAAAAGGGGAMGGLLGGAAGLATKAIPIVGWAMAAVDLVGKAFHFAQEQRAKNVYYQSIYGGANTEGFGQRLQEEGFTWGQFFTTGLQDEEARKLFKGVSAMGFKDSQRDVMLDFAQKQYKNMGMSVEQSLQAIEIAAAGSNTSLIGLETALNRVNKAARQSGQSAEVMRDKFMQSFGMATQAGYGLSAPQVAGIVTAAGPGQSRALQNVNYAGMFTEDQQRFTAAQMGISYGELVYQNATGNTAPGLEAKDQMIQTMIQNVLSPSQKQYLDEQIAQNGGADKVKANQGLQHSIGLGLLERGLDPGMVKQVAETMVGPGSLKDVPPDAIPEWIVQKYVGAGDLSDTAAADEASENQHKLTDAEKNNPDAIFNSDQSKFVAENYASDTDWIFSSAARSKDSTLEAYEDRQSETGMVDPGIEQFIQATGQYSEVGVEVETKSGKKVVPKDDAIRYFPDQVARGSARIVGGPPDIDGKTIGEITGIKQKDVTAANGRDTDTTNDEAPEDVGVTADEWRQSHDSSYDDSTANQAGGTYKIELSDEARRFFNLAPPASENPQVEAGAAAGYPPVGGR